METENLPKLFVEMLHVLSTRILGGSYQTANCAFCYFVLGGILHKNVIRVGAIEVDTRTNYLLAIKPGLGKRIYKNLVSEICSGIATVRIPTTLYPEELPGKSVRRQIKGGQDVAKKKFGYFADDFILVDDRRAIARSGEKGQFSQETLRLELSRLCTMYCGFQRG